MKIRKVETNLKLGTGDPWAGHESAKESEFSLRRFDIVLSAENFGADPPIGSSKYLI